jgi:RHS repeat-associated protein
MLAEMARMILSADSRSRSSILRRLSLIACIGALVAACNPTVPPIATPANSVQSTPAPVPAALEDCADLSFVPCPRQVAGFSLPIAGSAFSLVYVSDRVPGRTSAGSVDARPIGLGGWSLDVLASYDPATSTLVLGSGARRGAQSVPITMAGSAALAVPNVDGTSVFVFDTTGRQLATYDGITGARVYAFAWGTGGIASVTEAGDRVTRIRRDANGQPIEIVSARGYRTRLGTLGGWLAAVADPTGSITHITTAPNGLVNVVRDAAGAATTATYDADGRVTGLNGPNGLTVTFARTSSATGFTVTETTGGGRTASDAVRLDGAKVTRTHVDFAGRAMTVVVDGSARRVTTPDGTVSSFELGPDPRWGLAAPMVTNIEITTPAGRHETATEVRSAAQATAAVDPVANSRTLTIDGAAWTLRFDPSAKSVLIADPTGRTRTTTLDDLGRAIESRESGAAPTALRYDAHGQIDMITVGKGASARTWHYRSDRVTGDLIVTDPGGRAISFRADAAGNVAAIDTDAGTNVSDMRDPVGRVTSTTLPGGGSAHTAYRADGLIDVATAPAGASGLEFTTFGYDPDGLLMDVATADGTSTAVQRDTGGRVTQIQAAGGAPWTVTYDPSTGAATTYNGPGAKLERTFDGTALLSEAWSGPIRATVTRKLDAAGRDAADSVAGGPEIAYEYDAAGRLVQAGDLRITRDISSGRITEEHIGRLVRGWQYDAFGAVIGETVTAGTSRIYAMTLARDALGRVTRRTEQLAESIIHARTFTYALSGSLSSVTDDGRTTHFEYDADGNLVRETRPDGTRIDASYDTRDALIRRGATTYTYDAAGRLATETTAGATTSYTYDSIGSLVAVAPANGPKIEYVLDATGRRIGRSVGGAIQGGFAYLDALRPAAELSATGAVTSRFVYALDTAAPTYVVRDGRTLLVIIDNTGTPRMLVDATDGSVVASLDVDALGRTTSATGSAALPFGFAGGLGDSATDLVHFGARDYATDAARWTAPDPIGLRGGDPNLYRYVGGDPVNRVDSSGLLCDTFAIGGEASVAFGPRGSFQAGYVWQGNQPAAPFSDWSTGAGTPEVSLGLSFTCLWDKEPGASDRAPEYTGPDLSISGGAGPVSLGYDRTYGGNGGVDRWGVHGGPELGLAPASLSGDYGHWASEEENAQFEKDQERQAGCTGIDAGADGCSGDKDPGPDDPNTGGLCSETGTCEPDDGAPTSPAGGALSGARTLGDPHIWTADGVAYDFMAAGEFTELRADSGDLVIQARLAPTSASRSASFGTALAMNVNGDRLTFEREGTPLTVRLNGTAIRPTATITLAKGGLLTPESTGYLVAWPDHTLARVLIRARWVDVSMQLAAGRKGTVHGLLGPDSGATSSSIEARDGTRIKVPTGGKVGYDALYRTFGDSWRIAQAESLFDYGPGESTATFDDRTFPDRNPPAIPPDRAGAARQLCARLALTGTELADCAFDVAVTGDAGYAVTDANAALSGPSTVGVLAAGPPVDADQATPIEIDGPPVTARIAQHGSSARFSFVGAIGQKVYVDISASTLGDSCGTVSLQVPDALPFALGCTTNGAGAIDAAVLPANGTFYLVVDPQGDVTGQVVLRLSSATDQVGAIVEDGAAVPAAIGQPGAVARFTFAGSAGQRVFVTAMGATLPDACGVLSLRGPDGGVITLGCLSGGAGFIDGTILPANGAYTVEVDPAYALTGNVTLRLTTATDQTGAIELNGAAVTATIAQPGAIATFSFSGASGQKVFVDVSGSTLSDACGQLILRGSAGQVIAQGCIAAGSIDGTVLPASGQYTIVLDPAGTTIGSALVRIHP